MDSNDVPHVALKGFERSDDCFGWSVAAMDEGKRDYVLSAVAYDRGDGKFGVCVELAEEITILWRSNFIEGDLTKRGAGSACYGLAHRVLGAEMAGYMRGDGDLLCGRKEGFVGCSDNGFYQDN
jgi:hypothetical protein